MAKLENQTNASEKEKGSRRKGVARGTKEKGVEGAWGSDKDTKGKENEGCVRKEEIAEEMAIGNWVILEEIEVGKGSEINLS